MNIKNAVKRALGMKTVRRDQIANEIDLGRLGLIRQADARDLADPKKMEALMPRLGLNDEKIAVFPASLQGSLGTGLYIWQYPAQFSKYIAKLSTLRVRSYMEIGVRHGGTFVTTVEYLKKFGTVDKAVAVDINDCPSVVEYARTEPAVSFLKMDTRSDAFKAHMKQNRYDLVLIDGDHSYEGCKNDLDAVRESADMLAFHDIEENACPGVARAWNDLKREKAAEYDFFEFRDQYEGVEGRWMGIGLAVKKSRSRQTA